MINFLNTSLVKQRVPARRLHKLALAMLGLTALSAQANVNPLQINQLISMAVQTHPLVGAAVADQRAAAEGVTAAKLGYLPTPALSTQHDNTNGTVTRFTVNQPLWTGGRLTADVNRAINDDKAATAKILEQQNEVAKNTIDIWQAYIYSLSLQELYANNLRQLAEFEAMMQRRVAQGVSAKIELDLVTNRILQDQNSLQGAIEQQRIAEARLEQVIGVPVVAAGGVNIAQMAAEVKALSQNYGELAFSSVSESHPTVVRQRFEIDSARYEVKSQRASRYPTVYVQYQNDYLHRDRENEDDVMVGLSYNPGAGFSNLALARASEARVQSLIQSQEASRRSVMENIQTQYQQFVSARDQELSLVAAVAGAQIVLNSYQRQFIAGRKSWLEVLNAVREQSQYEQQLRQVQAQMVASFYKLQVDFAKMPWQQQSLNFIQQPSEVFSPYRYAKEEIDQYLSARSTSAPSVPEQNSQAALPTEGPMLTQPDQTTEDHWSYETTAIDEALDAQTDTQVQVSIVEDDRIDDADEAKVDVVTVTAEPMAPQAMPMAPQAMPIDPVIDAPDTPDAATVLSETTSTSINYQAVPVAAIDAETIADPSVDQSAELSP